MSQEAVKPWKQKLSPKEWLDIRYEDLVSRPEAVLKNVCDFLGEKYEAAMLDFWKGDIARRRGKQRDHKPLGEPVRNKYVGIYKSLLSIRDQQIFAAVAGKELEEAGYSPDMEPVEITPDDEERFREWDGRIRAALLDSKWGRHITEESYLDWLADRREERKKKGIWKPENVPAVFPLGHPHEELLTGKNAFNRWKWHFSIKRQYV